MCKRTNKLSFIGITQRLVEHVEYNELRETLALDWGDLFDKNAYFNRFLPLPLSYSIKFEKYAGALKAVILSGGGDLNVINPSNIAKTRDEYEKSIIEYCIKYQLPLLGICRGAQMIASYFSSSIKPCKNHIGYHNININNNNFNVNSYHNYAIQKLGDDLIPLAVCSDNTIEAFKHKKLNIYGIMWHIERKDGLVKNDVVQSWLKEII